MIVTRTQKTTTTTAAAAAANWVAQNEVIYNTKHFVDDVVKQVDWRSCFGKDIARDDRCYFCTQTERD